jgi:hypothetical protein
MKRPCAPRPPSSVAAVQREVTQYRLAVRHLFEKSLQVRASGHALLPPPHRAMPASLVADRAALLAGVAGWRLGRSVGDSQL